MTASASAAAPSRKNVLIVLTDDGDEAAAFARQFGGLLQLPVEDRRFAEPGTDE